MTRRYLIEIEELPDGGIVVRDRKELALHKITEAIAEPFGKEIYDNGPQGFCKKLTGRLKSLLREKPLGDGRPSAGTWVPEQADVTIATPGAGRAAGKPDGKS